MNNRIMFDYMRGEARIYYGKNEKMACENVAHKKGDNYPREILDNYNPNGFPKTKLVLKVGASIMLLRNINPPEGLCNGARFTVTELRDNLIVAEKSTGEDAGTLAFIPRILFHSGKKDVFRFERRQFPVQPAFAVTANKSQGQTYERAGLYLENSFFSHGQLYVAMSRVGKRENLKFYIPKETIKEKPKQFFTSNVVYHEVLRETDEYEQNYRAESDDDAFNDSCNDNIREMDEESE